MVIYQHSKVPQCISFYDKQNTQTANRSPIWYLDEQYSTRYITMNISGTLQGFKYTVGLILSKETNHHLRSSTYMARNQDIPVWTSCQIRKIAGAHVPGMPGTLSPPPRVSDPDRHHSTCVTYMLWCIPESLTNSFLWSRQQGKTFPAFLAHAQPTILRIW